MLETCPIENWAESMNEDEGVVDRIKFLQPMIDRAVAETSDQALRASWTALLTENSGRFESSPGLVLSGLLGFVESNGLGGKVTDRLFQDTVAYIYETCARYAQIKSERGLTDDEKQVRVALSELLKGWSDSIHSRREDRQRPAD